MRQLEVNMLKLKGSDDDLVVPLHFPLAPQRMSLFRWTVMIGGRLEAVHVALKPLALRNASCFVPHLTRTQISLTPRSVHELGLEPRSLAFDPLLFGTKGRPHGGPVSRVHRLLHHYTLLHLATHIARRPRVSPGSAMLFLQL